MHFEGNPTVTEFDPFTSQQAGTVTGPVTGSQFQYGPMHNVGETVDTADGRAFRFQLVNASNPLVAGTINTPAIEKTNHQELAPASAVTSSSTTPRIVNKQVTVTLGATSALANEYNHGFATWSSGSNVGLSYEISYHPAANSAASLQLTFFDFLQNDVATSDTVDLSHNQWYNVLQSSASSIQTTRSAGVCMVAAAASYGCWGVTHGLVGCIGDGTVAVGTSLVLSNSTAGAVTGQSTTWSTAVAQIVVGYAGIVSAIATNSKPVFLTID
jgi:hypothetical protein